MKGSMKLNKIDYKGKWFVLQDIDYKVNDDWSFMDIVIGTMTKKEVLDKDFIKEHKANCEYYGIPCYIGENKELKKIFD